MHSVIPLFVFWALAFLTLCVTLMALNIFWNLIGQDLNLHSLCKEAVIAGIASFIEGTSVWLVVTSIPQGGLALFIPALVVGIIYKITHLEDWSRYEVICLLGF